MPTPALRPLSTGELLDRTFLLYRSHFPLFVGIIAVTHLVILAVQLVGIAILPKPAGPLDLGATLLWLPVTLLTMLAVTAASQGATVVAVSHVYLDRPVTVVDALSHIRGRIVSLAITMIVIGLGVALGLILLIVPGIILSLMWAVAIPVAVLEERSMLDAASRSADLTKGDRGRVAVIYVLFVVLVWIVSMVVNVPIGIIGFLYSGGDMTAVNAWVQVASAVGSFLTQCLVGPLMTIAFSLLYYDERVRKEAFDLELMMSAIDGRPADGAPAPFTGA
ncbi:MAG TPA: hypothetical protein VGK32_11295 [Vicinamibacterales bacterium]|jgi:hypothetical protein